MVYRVFVEKKREYANEAAALLSDIRTLLGIGSVTGVRFLNRYDAENISKELFDYAVQIVLSEPQLDMVSRELDAGDGTVFAVEYLPGQFDQRSDSAEQCIQILSCGERPTIRSARVYVLEGNVTQRELEEIKKYVINPVDSREAALEKPETIVAVYDTPGSVAILDGFNAMDEAERRAFLGDYGLAMDEADLAFCQEYFRREGRDPSITELRVIDTYWSDHCRHTTFNTIIDSVTFEDALLQSAYEDYLRTREALGRTKSICLMDVGTLAGRYLRATGKLAKLDESDEVNACTVKITVTVDGKEEPWLLLFKNETHNHPTEIEPFGGAATCIGGAIRDPLSGRSYVYGAMRVTGAADPLTPVSETIPGKLPQRKLVTTAAAGYSSYGNQIGLATGIVDEVYHPGYAAKHMEVGAVVGAAPEANVRRETPAAGDVVILLGGATGRDGIGGATGSSKSHDSHSVENCGAEVQKGNAPEERKLQRLFRNGEVTRMIKRCNDFGAGGVSVAIGELAEGLEIDLNAVPRKYDGLDGTELAISESQERMAVVVEKDSVPAFLAAAGRENLSATPVAVVTDTKRLRMHWNGAQIVDISREFLDTNGADRHISVEVAAPALREETVPGSFRDGMLSVAGDLNTCSRRGLSERFDSTIGAGTVLMPFGGRHQRTPIQAMVQKIPVERGVTEDCSLMSWAYDPYLSEQSPYHGAYLAVVSSIAKLIATGADFSDVYLTFQEYFGHPGKDGKRWSQPLSAVLGAFKAQMDMGVAAVGGKDSMSGTFEDLDVPPTLISFAVTTARCGDIVSPEFKAGGHTVVRIAPELDENGLPVADSQKKVFGTVASLLASRKAVACWALGMGGAAEAVLKMCLGNEIGFAFDDSCSLASLFARGHGAFLLEMAGGDEGFEVLGHTTENGCVSFGGDSLTLSELLSVYEGKLESVYPTHAVARGPFPTLSSGKAAPAAPHVGVAVPRVLIPVFPGTNCEYDSARAVRAAGAEAEIYVINNLTTAGIERSVDEFARKMREAQMVFLAGGFSGGDEPDGSAKFITSFFRSAPIRESVEELLERRQGLMCGVCNGFQALIKLGLVPYGRIVDTDADCATLTFNTIARHQSRIVRTRVVSTLSPFLSLTEVGQVYNVPISHGEGRFVAPESLIRSLAENGQIATQYVDMDGEATGDILYNPNGSMYSIEGITSPDGRVFGKMGHSERVGSGLYRNVPGNYDIRMFEAAVRYFHD